MAAVYPPPIKERNWSFAEEKSCPLTFVSSPIRPWRILILPYPRNGIPVPHRIKITVARKKLLAQRRRREGVYYPKGHRQPSSRSKRDFSRRSRHKGAGG